MEWEQMDKKHIKTYFVYPGFDCELHIHGVNIRHTEGDVKIWEDLEIAINHFKIVERWIAK